MLDKTLIRGLSTQASRLSTSGFARAMQEAKVERGFVVYRNGEIKSSHPVMEPVLDLVKEDTVDYDNHEGLFFQAYKDCLFGAFLWKTNRGQGCGGVRLRTYDSLESHVRDGMRLAIGMGRKNALANLWWGGGKGVIAYDDPAQIEGESRKELLHKYGEFITSLRGCYVGAEDAGISVADIDTIYERTRFMTCISPSIGGSGNPSIPTAMGVVCGMEGALDSLNKGSLDGKTIAIQGCGNVGGPMIGFLLEKGVKRIVATEFRKDRREEMRALYEPSGKVEIREADDSILFEDVDILSPCAFGGILNDTTVPRIKADIICGAANNQLLDPSTDYGMTKRGITYCPDYVVNRMGIVNCSNEGFGRVGSLGSVDDPIISVHLERQDDNSVYNITRRVIEMSKEQNISTAKAADMLADIMSVQPHPIFGHRSQLIIDRLIEDGWATK